MRAAAPWDCAVPEHDAARCAELGVYIRLWPHCQLLALVVLLQFGEWPFLLVFTRVRRIFSCFTQNLESNIQAVLLPLSVTESQSIAFRKQRRDQLRLQGAGLPGLGGL